MLPSDLKTKAMNLARKQGLSLGELIRDSLQARLQQIKGGTPMPDPLFSDREIFKGKVPADLSTNTDSYLYDDLH